VSIRAFIALELPDSARDILLSAGGAVRDADPRWRGEKWVPACNLHVTLKFLGTVGEDALDALGESMVAELEGSTPFELELAGLRATPRPRDARMLWGMLNDPDGACCDLAERVERAALAIGVPPEQRAFSPHVTLVRARRPHAITADALSSGDDVIRTSRASVSVARASLFSSRTLPTGPEYRAIGEWQLSAG